MGIYTTYILPYLAVVSVCLALLFVLEVTVQSSNVWQDLDCKLIAIPDAHLGILARAHTSWRTRDDDRAHWQSSSLGQEADDLCNAKYEITDEEDDSAHVSQVGHIELRLTLCRSLGVVLHFLARVL